MRTLLLSLIALGLAGSGHAADAAPLVYLAGDSTMATKPLDSTERGWGMAMHGLMKDPAMIQNHAVNGRSTKSFINEGRWARLVAALQPGDFVIIQFGHNDEKIDRPAVGADVKTEFPDNLRRFIRDVRAKQAHPILATPVARRNFDHNGKLQPTHGAYPDAVRAVAAEEKVPLLELERATEAWLRELGDEPSKKFFNKLPNGQQDNTHFVEAGAVHVAELACAQIREQKLPLAQWLK